MQTETKSECSLACCQSIKAYYKAPFLVIIAEGTKPTPCHWISIERSWITVDPPEFSVRQCIESGTYCVQVITPFRETGIFFMLHNPGMIVVHDCHGEIRVKVETVSKSTLDVVNGISVEVESSIPSVASVAGDEAYGISPYYSGSFERAFYDALNYIPPTGLYSEYKIVEQGYWRGGFLQYNHWFVRVKRTV